MPPSRRRTRPKSVFEMLLPEIAQAVAEEGYTTPSPIQERSIPPLLEGRDLIGCAQTGTGKTAAFALPIIQHLSENRRRPGKGRPRVLIMAPTRELAAQIRDSFATYGRHTKVSQTAVFGGVNQSPQVGAVRRGIDVLVATPGRLLDLMDQGHILLDEIEIFVLDEADRMLDMGFLPDIRKLIAEIPKQRQSLFFSATMEPEIVSLARTLVADPVQVTIDPEKPAVERIVQKVLFVTKEDKDALVADILRDADLDRVLVFVQMKHVANKVAKKLDRAGISAAAIHGNKSQAARTKALASFKTGKVRVLVATDIAARGIDVDGISHVINFDMPIEPEVYVHRIGRTARAGNDGDAISLCSARERDQLRAVEKLLRRKVPVDLKHPYHSEEARRATGEAARPLPKAQRGQRRPSKAAGKRAANKPPARPAAKKAKAPSKSKKAADVGRVARGRGKPRRRRR